MNPERRYHPRVSGPFMCICHGAATQREARIVDLSEGGCFVDMLSPLTPGGRLEIKIHVGDIEAHLQAEVVYLDRVQGFAARFVNNEPAMLDRLREIMRARAARTLPSTTGST
ncbi:MAG: PilZ domain-containing protein [Acidobacteriota bacterium]